MLFRCLLPALEHSPLIKKLEMYWNDDRKLITKPQQSEDMEGGSLLRDVAGVVYPLLVPSISCGLLVLVSWTPARSGVL